jgi:hypothetical protein
MKGYTDRNKSKIGRSDEKIVRVTLMAKQWCSLLQYDTSIVFLGPVSEF